MVCVRLPRRPIAFVCLVSPHGPILPRATRKEFKKWSRAARFDDFVLLVGFARMFAFAGGKQIDLAPAGRKRTRILSAHAKQNEFGHIAKIEANATAVRAAVLSYLVPNDIGLVAEAPCLHDRQAFGQKGVRAPQVQMRLLPGDMLDRKRLDIVERERAIAREAPVFRRHLPGLVGELPRRVCEDRRKFPLTGESEEIEAHAVDRVRKHAKKLQRLCEHIKNIHSVELTLSE